MMAGRKKGEVEGDAGQAEWMEVTHDLEPGQCMIDAWTTLPGAFQQGTRNNFCKVLLIWFPNKHNQSECSQTEWESVNTTSGDDVRHI